jgi:Domain of unknown function (DUF6134)
MKVLLALPFLFYAISAGANALDEQRWQFEVLLDDKKIGYHDFVVSDNGDTQTINMEAKFDVKLLFVKVFSYEHQNEEVWQNGCLASIDAETVSNGKDFVVRGKAADNEFQLQSASIELPPCVMSFAYWNPEFLKAEKLLNSQTGDYEEVAIRKEAVEELSIAGRKVEAIKYSLSGAAAPISLWYSVAEQRWLALESVVRGGRTLRYNPVRLPGSIATSQGAGD